MSTTANASHLLLELLQRGGFAASTVLWRDTGRQREDARHEGTRGTTKLGIASVREKEKERENKGLDEGERISG